MSVNFLQSTKPLSNAQLEILPIQRGCSEDTLTAIPSGEATLSQMEVKKLVIGRCTSYNLYVSDSSLLLGSFKTQAGSTTMGGVKRMR